MIEYFQIQIFFGAKMNLGQTHLPFEMAGLSFSLFAGINSISENNIASKKNFSVHSFDK